MRKTASRLIAAGLTAAALTLGLTVGAVTTASAAATAPQAPAALGGPSCHDASCHGHDPSLYVGPDGQGCTASTVTAEKANGFVAVWNRYSNDCDANWGRAQLTPQSVRNGYSMQVVTTTTDSDLQHEHMCYPSTQNNVGSFDEQCDKGTYGGGAVVYTDMVDGTNVATACATVYSGPTDSYPPIDSVCVSL